MSVVTSAVLHLGTLFEEREREALAWVNALFRADAIYAARGDAGFVSVADAELPPHWYGGTKALECALALGAFNYLNLDSLVPYLCALCQIGMLDADEAQLMVQGEGEARFSVINMEDVIMRGNWRDARCQAMLARCRAYQRAGRQDAAVLAGLLAGRYAILADYEARVESLATDAEAAADADLDAERAEAMLRWEAESAYPTGIHLPHERECVAEFERQLTALDPSPPETTDTP